jgi:radical SAM superfamily enzyme YgiQ (UPF0313 family)
MRKYNMKWLKLILLFLFITKPIISKTIGYTTYGYGSNYTLDKNFVENLKFIKEDYKKLDDKILKLIERGHTVQQFKDAILLLRQAGFKVDLHFMPMLPGSNPKKDVEMYKKLYLHSLLHYALNNL